MGQVAGLIAIAVIALPAASGAVTLNPLSQDREVAVEIQVRTDTCPPPSEPPNGCYEPGNPPTSTTFDDYADIESAPDFGPFVATAMDPAFGRTDAWQSSSISTSALLASGTWEGWANASLSFIGPPLELLQVTERHVSQNRYEVAFELSSAAAFSLTGALDLVAWGQAGNASIELVGPGSTPVAGIALELWSNCDLNVAINFVCEAALSEGGLLAPGVYTLRATGRSVAQSYIGPTNPHDDSAGGSFDVELLIEEPPPVPALPPGGAVLLGGALVAAVAAARRLPAGRGSGRHRHSQTWR